MLMLKKIFIRLIVLVYAGALVHCGLIGTDDEGTPFMPIVDGNLTVSDGALLKMWIHVPGDVQSVNQIKWRTGKGKIARRNQALSGDNIKVDTIYVFWDEKPTVTRINVSQDTSVLDFQPFYYDSIWVSINNKLSAPVSIEVLHILPKLDSVYVNSVSAGVDNSHFDGSDVNLYGHPGQRVKVDLKILSSDTIGVVDIEWPSDLSFNLVKEGTPADPYEYMWNVPTGGYIDTTYTLFIGDNGSSGKRAYNLNVLTYSEAGTVWVGSSDGLVKLTNQGKEIFRIENYFDQIADIKVHPRNDDVWVADRGRNAVIRMDYDGNVKYVDSLGFLKPDAIDIDIESDFIWVADKASAILSSGQLRRFDTSGNDSLVTNITPVVFDNNQISDIAIDQYEQDFLWFVSAEGDFVGFARNGVVDTIFSRDDLNFDRPQTVAYDHSTNYVWIGDSSRVLVVDTLGRDVLTITGFKKITEISVGHGGAWILDQAGTIADGIERGGLFRFDNNAIGNLSSDRGTILGALNFPTGVDSYDHDGTAWVTDTENGVVYKVNVNGEIVTTSSGINRPTVIEVNQGVQ